MTNSYGPRRSRRALGALAALALALLGLLAGASAHADAGPPPAALPSAAQMTAVKVYFLRNGDELAVVHRVGSFTRAPAARSLRLLLAGPNAAERASGLTSAVPPKSAFRWVIRRGQVANVNLSSDFAPGVRLTLSPQVAEVVYTLTQFPTIKLVRFLIEGRKTEVLAETTGTTYALLGRQVLASYVPRIFLESPGFGEQVPSPIVIEGSALGSVLATLVDADGKLLARRLLVDRAETRRHFTVFLKYRVDVEQQGRLVLFKLEGARPGLQVTLPLTLVP